MATAYDQLLNANLAADYQVPDWFRQSGLGLDMSQDKVNGFFAANPEYAQDWQNITSGGKSAYATDGSTLVKSNLNQMPTEVANHYRENVPELLAREGFGLDPVLGYMNYYNGAGSIGINPQNTNVTEYLRDHKWTPQGIVYNNNQVGYNKTPYGAGTASLQGGPSGQSPQGGSGFSTKPMQVGGGQSGVYGGGSSFNAAQNPYLQQQMDMLTKTATDNWQRQIVPQISSGAQLAGGYGGSRQGVLEANSANDVGMQIANGLAGLAGNAYSTGLQYDLGLQNNQLGWGNLGLGQQSLDRQINNDNNQWNLTGAQLGMQLQDRQLQQNAMGLANGSQINNNAYNNLNQFGQLYNSIGQGYGSTSQSGGGGNPLMGALGGMQLGNQVGNWWNSNNSNPATSWFSGNSGMGD